MEQWITMAITMTRCLELGAAMARLLFKNGKKISGDHLEISELPDELSTEGY